MKRPEWVDDDALIFMQVIIWAGLGILVFVAVGFFWMAYLQSAPNPKSFADAVAAGFLSYSQSKMREGFPDLLKFLGVCAAVLVAGLFIARWAHRNLDTDENKLSYDDLEKFLSLLIPIFVAIFIVVLCVMGLLTLGVIMQSNLDNELWKLPNLIMIGIILAFDWLFFALIVVSLLVRQKIKGIKAVARLKITSPAIR